MRPGVSVACLGDVMLDVIVEAPEGLVPDDDTPAEITFAAGGQAANVATWVSALGGRATLFGPRSDHGHGGMVEAALAARGMSFRDLESRALVPVGNPIQGTLGAAVQVQQNQLDWADGTTKRLTLRVRQSCGKIAQKSDFEKLRP